MRGFFAGTAITLDSVTKAACIEPIQYYFCVTVDYVLQHHKRVCKWRDRLLIVESEIAFQQIKSDPTGIDKY